MPYQTAGTPKKKIKKFMNNILLIFIALLLLSCVKSDKEQYKIAKSSYKIKNLRKAPSQYVINGTFLGNEKRNYYGNEAPSKLNVVWKTSLGSGQTRVGKDVKMWSGAGWTGQPLVVKDTNGEIFILQGTYEHNIKKIRLSDGKVVAKYYFDDVIKGTGTVWEQFDELGKLKDILILQGSRYGLKNSLATPVIPSYRAVSFFSMKDVWQYNSQRTDSYSRDVDGSCLIINDTAYLGLENGIFIVFDPNPIYAEKKDGLLQPLIYNTDSLYFKTDIKNHRGNLVTESSPCYLNGKIYITSGSGHVFGYNIGTKKIEWCFDTGSDMDGSPVVTNDNKIIIAIEKEYIPGQGGIMKLDPSKSPENAVEWFFPTGNQNFAMWQGGVIGSVGITDFYNDTLNLATFVGIDGWLYVVKHTEIDSSKTVNSPDNKKEYFAPKLIFSYKTGPSISTPIIVKNKLIAATYNGVYLFEFDNLLNFKLLDQFQSGSFESTPFVFNKKIYVASRDGNLYCFGD